MAEQVAGRYAPIEAAAMAGAEPEPETIVPNATQAQDPSEPRLNAWDNWVDIPLSLTAIPFLVAYALPIVRPNLSEFVRHVCDGVIIALWVLHIIDYFMRLYLAYDRRRFVKRNIIDLIAIAVPFLRPLRMLRLISLIGTFTRVGAHTLRGKMITYIIGWTSLIVIVGSLALTEAERDHVGANITTWGSGLWFALGAITDTDFSELEPVSDIGRAVGMLLMLTGVALVGMVTAVLASWLVEKMSDETNPNSPATSGEMEKLEEQITKLTERISQLGGGEAGGGIDPALKPTYGEGLDPNYGKPSGWIH